MSKSLRMGNIGNKDKTHTHTHLKSGALNYGLILGFPCSSVSKESACNAGDLGSIPGLGRFPLEKEMATHYSILAWRIPRREEPGGL